MCTCVKKERWTTKWKVTSLKFWLPILPKNYAKKSIQSHSMPTVVSPNYMNRNHMTSIQISKSGRNWNGSIYFILIPLSLSSLFSWSYTQQEIARLRFRNSLQPGVGQLRHSSQWKVQIQDTTNQMRGADGWRSARLRNESYTGLAGAWCLCTVIWAKLPCWAPCSSVQCQGRSMPPSSVKTPARTIRKPHTNIFTIHLYASYACTTWIVFSHYVRKRWVMTPSF